jgi:hypothetical protein
LICYYFKRKYENLEIAQNEQAKVLYQLLQQNVPPNVKNLNEIINKLEPTDKNLNDSHDQDVCKESNDSDSDSESDSDDETVFIDKNEDDIKKININDIEEISLDQEEKTKQIKIDVNVLEMNLDSGDLTDSTDTNEKDYSKMSIKQLKEILSVKGINANKLKKVEMIDLIEKSSDKTLEKSKSDNFDKFNLDISDNLDKSLDKEISSISIDE